jgi:hypothetical protein
MRTEVRFITPQLAELYLKKNVNNRDVNVRIVNYYADEMTRGQWKLTGQGISFDDNNNLLDGQHRLRAVIKSGISVQMLLIFGVDPSTFEVYDTGKIRSANDVFSIRGIPNNKNITAAIKVYKILEMRRKNIGSSSRELNLSNIDIVQEYYKYEVFWQDVFRYSHRLYEKYRIYTTSTIIGFIAYLILDKKHPTEKVYSFLNSLFGLENNINKTPETLREMLIKDAMSIRRIKAIDKTTLLILAWNYFIQNKSVQSFRLDKIDNTIDAI